MDQINPDLTRRVNYLLVANIKTTDPLIEPIEHAIKWLLNLQCHVTS